jgi:hypothetical protein
MWTGFYWLRIRSNGDFCVSGDETSSSIITMTRKILLQEINSLSFSNKFF